MVRPQKGNRLSSLLVAPTAGSPHPSPMNPDKLFDYLDGNLTDYERTDLEQRLMEDPQLRREFEVARKIHSGMQTKGSERREVFGELPEETAARGRQLARRVALAFGVLVFVNVLLGLLYIAHHESQNPNRALLENQTREQLRKALDQAVATSLTPPPIGIGELEVTAEKGRTEEVADGIVKLTSRLNGTATKGVPDQGRVEVLAELPGNRVNDFRNALSSLNGIKTVAPSNAIPAEMATDQKTSIVVQVIEAK